MSHSENQPKDIWDEIAEMEAKNYSKQADLEKFKQMYFHFGDYELKRYQEFVAEQLASGKIRYGFCGGNFSITFCPTGIGVEVIAKCADTGASMSLVDPESW